MSYRHLGVLGVLVVVTLLITVEPALAGPGGKIARAAFETFWGRIILFALVIIFLPLIIIGLIKEGRASRRARRDLAYVGRLSAAFDWLTLRQRIFDCFHRIHAAWSKEDVREASEYMTGWYWQNQQLVYLDQWQEQGLVNHCTVKKISRLKPLLFSHRNEGTLHEGSMLVVSISAHMQDYLARRDTGAVVEGSKKFKDVETLWTFMLTDGRWKVSNIEESSMLDEYLRMVADLPPVEDTVRAEAPAA